MAQRLLTIIISLLSIQALLLVDANPAWGAEDWLDERQQAWPHWQLPAPLPRPRQHQDLIYPEWLRGEWMVESTDLADQSRLEHPARFHALHPLIDGKADVVGDRRFNARAIGEALLGEQLLSVEQAPEQVNRQLAHLSDDRTLETTVIGRRQTSTDQRPFVSDELVLQILHGNGPPRISRIETLSRYSLCADDINLICAEQLQARYPGPGAQSSNQALNTSHYELRLTRQRDQPAGADPRVDPSNGTGIANGDDH